LMWQKDQNKYKVYKNFISQLAKGDVFTLSDLSFKNFYNQSQTIKTNEPSAPTIIHIQEDQQSLFNFGQSNEKMDTQSILDLDLQLSFPQKLKNERKGEDNNNSTLAELIKPIIKKKIKKNIDIEQNYEFSEFDEEYLQIIPQ